ncbi:MAG: hypothetical protein JWN12_633 [Candidatus Saccharibacteria bacterium]|nr:hypothetical protein [Candidatus Saccharibacteria bacterium]
MTKLLKVRILLPLLMLGYVLLGGLVVPRVDRTIGHVLLIVLAIASLAVLIYGFYRYDKYHRDPSMHLKIFRTTLLAGVGLLALIIYHVVAISTGLRSLTELYGGEVAFFVLALGTWLVYENNKPAGV